MKDFLKKVFFFDRPAQGAFAGFTLLLASFWIVPALILLQRDFPLNVMPFRATFFTVGCLIGVLLAVLYALTVWVRFYFRRCPTEIVPWNAPGRLALYAVGLLTVLLSGWLFFWFLRGGHTVLSLTAPAMLVLLIAILWIPLFRYPAQWKIILVRGMCLSAAIGCSVSVILALNFSILGLLHICCIDDYFTGPVRWLHPAAFAAVFLWILAYVLSAAMYAHLGQIRVRKIFSRTTVTVLGLWAGIYLISLGMAYAARSRTDRTMAELEKHFGQKITLDALNAAYCRNRSVDEAFWQQVKSCIEQAYPSDPKSGMDVMISGTPDGIYPESTFRQFKSGFEKSEPRKQIERMLTRRLPARKLRILSGDITCLDLSELNWCRDICRWELWQVRFALADGKLPDAYAAMERMKRVTDYLGNRTNSLLTTLVLITCERYRMLGFELLLASGKVPDKVLNRWTAELEQDEKTVPGIHFDTLYAEAVFAASVVRSAAHGGTDSEGKYYPGLYALRYLYPPLWFFCTLDRDRYMRCFKVRSFGEMGWPGKKSGILREMMLPARQSADKKIMVLTVWYRAMRALIGTEQEKRRTGKYPDTLKKPPADPFTGKPMHYKKGKMPLIVKVWNPALKRFVSEKREADGIAVWSVGWNRKNEQGQDQATARKYADDVRAKIIFKKDSRD